MRTRDELCKNGDVLLTPALSYTDQHLRKALEKEKKEKLTQEHKEDEEKKRSADTTAETVRISTCDAPNVTFQLASTTNVDPPLTGIEQL